MKQIPLTQGKFATVDDEDFEYLNQWKWSVKKTRNDRLYAVRVIGGRSHAKMIYMHRVVSKAPDGMDVDHIDHDGLNNQNNNLRICTRAENGRNRRLDRDNASGYKGVSKYKNGWRARLKKGEKLVLDKSFLSKVEAAIAYDEAAKEYFGDFALLNFPNGDVK